MFKKLLNHYTGLLGAIIVMASAPVAGDFVISGPGQWHSVPDVAFDGTNYLVVWRNYRSDNYDIYGQFVNTAGTLVGDNFPVATSAKDENHPAIVWDGTKYFVSYSDDNYWPVNIDGRFVSASGTVSDSFEISDYTTEDHLYSAVAFDGTNYLVVWKDYRNGGSVWTADIYGQMMDTSGARIGTNFAISTAEKRQTRPAVAFDGRNYLVVWEDYRKAPEPPPYMDSANIYGQRVNLSGGLEGDEVEISIAEKNQVNPAIAFDGTNYLVVWQDGRNISTSDFDIYSQRIDTAGNLIGDNFAISTANSAQIFPAIVFDGMNYLVVWSDRRNTTNGNIYAQRVDVSGNLVDTNFAISRSFDGQFYPAVTSDGNKCLVVWYGNEPNDSIYGNIDTQVGIEEKEKSDPELDSGRSPKSEICIYPNPFSTTTAIKLSGYQAIKSNNPIARLLDSSVALEIYDLSGRLVRSFTINHQLSTINQMVWDGRDSYGNEVKSGIYFCELKVNGTETKKLIVIR